MSLRLSKTVAVSVNADDLLPEDDGCDDYEKNSDGWINALLGIFTTHPSDWHLAVNERLETIDWDSKSATVAQPLGNVLTFTFYTVRLLQNSLIRPNLRKINKRTDNFDLSKSELLKQYEYLSRYTLERGQTAESLYYRVLGHLSRLFGVLIIFLLLTNSYVTYKYLMGDFRTYSFFYLKQSPHSKNITKSSLKQLGKDKDEQSLWSLLCYFCAGAKDRNKASSPDDDDDDHFYQLSKWTPSKFITTMFVSFSPTCMIFLLLTDVSFSTVFAVLFHQWALRFLIINRYSSRIEHESVIASATLAEWDAKFVKPKMSRKVQDVAIDATPYGDGIIKFFPALSTNRSHTFQTHSLSGDIITETFNPETQEFEDLDDDIPTHNVVKTLPHIDQYFFRGEPYGRQRSVAMNESPHQFFRNREQSPPRLSRVSPQAGFCGSLASSTSGMSTPLVRPERPTYLNPAYSKTTLSGREDYFTNELPRGKSKSPLRNPPYNSRSELRSPDWHRDRSSSLSSGQSAEH